ncbi:MAG: hypothetical protein DYH16_05015, partial [Nitrosomonas sp. PRO5]|nr:hypothetical protein [Nitrosomonas sp. PRO5]
LRTGYRVGIPGSSAYQEVFNSDSIYYDGSNAGNAGRISPTEQPWSGQPDSIIITLPPLAGVILKTADG